MAKITVDGADKSEGDLIDKLTPVMANITITTNPVVICGVQRKANVGNFETIDIYMAVALPVLNASVEDMEDLKAKIEELADYGFKQTSLEATDRYKLIKESLK